MIKKEKKVGVLTAKNNHYGSGHYSKSRELQKALLKDEQDVLLFVLSQYPYKKTKEEIHLRKIEDIFNFLQTFSIDTLIIDKRENPVDFIKKLNQLKVKTIIIDSIGSDRLYSTYNINPIPYPQPDHNSNLWDISYLPPNHIPKQKSKGFQISIFFGFSDTQELTLLFLEKIHEVINLLNISTPIDHINIFMGEGNNIIYYNKMKKLCLNNLKHIPYTIYWKSPLFKEIIIGSSLFITYYGMSAMEAASKKVPLLLYNPSPYHAQLSTHFFPHQTIKDITKIPSHEKLLETTQHTFSYLTHTLKIGENFNKLSNIISHINNAPSPNSCKHCESQSIEVVYRYINENLYHCHQCHLIYKLRILPNKLIHEDKTIVYNDKYFLEEYQKSYNKTYENDKEHIYTLSRSRLHQIKKYKKKGNLLDIGCALGYFLDIAKLNHFNTHGVEVSQYAVKKTQHEHQIFHGSIFDFHTDVHFDVVTIWYVIEHFEQHQDIFKKISELQHMGDILALSTPNGAGLSAKYNPSKFFKTSPQDHYYIYTHTSLKNILKIYGYKHLKTNSTGIHYKRFQKLFPRLSKWIPKPIYLKTAQFFNLGDTFEIYFKKVKD